MNPRPRKVRGVDDPDIETSAPQAEPGRTGSAPALQFVSTNLPPIDIEAGVSTRTLERWQEAISDQTKWQHTPITFDSSAVTRADSDRLKHEADAQRRREVVASSKPVTSLKEAAVYDQRESYLHSPFIYGRC